MNASANSLAPKIAQVKMATTETTVAP